MTKKQPIVPEVEEEYMWDYIWFSVKVWCVLIIGLVVFG